MRINLPSTQALSRANLRAVIFCGQKFRNAFSKPARSARSACGGGSGKKWRIKNKHAQKCKIFKMADSKPQKRNNTDYKILNNTSSSDFCQPTKKRGRKYAVERVMSKRRGKQVQRIVFTGMLLGSFSMINYL